MLACLSSLTSALVGAATVIVGILVGAAIVLFGDS